jgi:hypothetical protein
VVFTYDDYRGVERDILYDKYMIHINMSITYERKECVIWKDIGYTLDFNRPTRDLNRHLEINRRGRERTIF